MMTPPPDKVWPVNMPIEQRDHPQACLASWHADCGNFQRSRCLRTESFIPVPKAGLRCRLLNLAADPTELPTAEHMKPAVVQPGMMGNKVLFIPRVQSSGWELLSQSIGNYSGFQRGTGFCLRKPSRVRQSNVCSRPIKQSSAEPHHVTMTTFF